MAETFRPPKGVREEASRALGWIQDGKHGSGMTSTGRARARQLASGDPVGLDTVLAMYAYLKRHEVDKAGAGFTPGSDGYPSAGRVAWAAWGGDPGLTWSTSIRNKAVDRAATVGGLMTEQAVGVKERRALPPSYRPSTSDDVPVFRPACASCELMALRTDPTGAQLMVCTKWEAPVVEEQYCDAYEACAERFPAWLRDDDELDDDEDEVVDPVEDDAATEDEPAADNPMRLVSASPTVEARAAAADQPTADALAALLEQVVALYARAHEAHWNVTSAPGDPAGFQAFHDLFGEIYDDVHGSLDPIAENIRKLGSLAPALVVPGADASITDPQALAQELLDLNDATATACRAAFDVATQAGQQGIANFLAERQDMHQKWSWQLRSSLGIAEVSEARRSAWAGAETRNFDCRLASTRGADGTITVRGYAAVFDEEATGLPFREVIRRGAFADTLSRGDDVFLLVNHDTDQLPLARRSSGTLALAEDDTGLLIEATLDPANPRAAEVASVLDRGDASQMSFAFRVAEGGQRKTDGLRELTNLDLYEVSIVTWPAYDGTSVGLRTAVDPKLRLRAALARQKHLALAY